MFTKITVIYKNMKKIMADLRCIQAFSCYTISVQTTHHCRTAARKLCFYKKWEIFEIRDCTFQNTSDNNKKI